MDMKVRAQVGEYRYSSNNSSASIVGGHAVTDPYRKGGNSNYEFIMKLWDGTSSGLWDRQPILSM